MRNNAIKTGVTFILTRPNGEILMQQRDDGQGRKIPYLNMWCFPGGGREEKEDYLATVVREVLEEYSIELQREQCALIGKYDHDDIVNDNLFVCRVDGTAEPILREGRSMRWMKIQEIEKLSLAWEQNKIIFLLKKYLSQKFI